MVSKTPIITRHELKRAAPEFVALDDALQAALDVHGEWYAREWLYSRLGRIQGKSRNRVPKAHKVTP